MRDNRGISSSGSVGAEQIVELIRAHQPVSAEELVSLLGELLPAGLPEAQKLARVHSQLRHLVDVGKVRNRGSRRYPRWGLAE